ncbi:MAG: hypothetical protein N2484_03530 [Clostridia bacterium]|nr:hypothetical protein [Clostridia bacterium]
MEFIHRLPFIIGAFMAIVVGVVNYKSGIEQQQIYSRMTISLIAFFIIGLLIRNTVSSIYEDLEKKKRDRQELEEELERQAHAKSMHEEAENSEAMEGAGGIPTQIDYRVDEGEEFTPLKVSEVLSSKLHE